jgi:hypothetical protein
VNADLQNSLPPKSATGVMLHFVGKKADLSRGKNETTPTPQTPFKNP